MSKLSVCILFGGRSPEHDVSLRSAESVLNNIDREKYNVIPVGITKNGDWLRYAGTDYSLLPGSAWESFEGNRRAAISPIRGQGLLCFEGDCVVREHIDVVFPVLHGENGEDGTIQGLLELAGIAYVGPHVAASAVAMDKTLTKLVADQAGIPQAAWQLVRGGELQHRMDAIVQSLEARFAYPMFVKPAGTGSSVGVSKAADRESLTSALVSAAAFDDKILVEEFIHGREVEVAVMGNDNPVASVCGEIDSGAEEQVREQAVKVYQAIGCQGLSRVDFFVTFEGNRIVFNEINTLPGFTSISMYPKLFAASGIGYSELIDELLKLAMEACK